MTAPFDLDRFRTALTTAALGHEVIYLPTTTSTMDDARMAAAGGRPHGTIVLAEHQTAGRGRRGRSFYAPPEGNLYFTFILHIPRQHLQQVPLAVPLAVCDAVRVTGLDARIKWPNDIWVAGRKLAGILVDAGSVDAFANVFPGVGINVNGDPTVAPGLAGIATSIARELGAPLAREPLLADLCGRLEANLGESRSALLARYRALSLVLGREVEVTPTGDSPFLATAVDIAPDGDLVVRLPSGECIAVIAADVSVRPAASLLG